MHLLNWEKGKISCNSVESEELKWKVCAFGESRPVADHSREIHFSFLVKGWPHKKLNNVVLLGFYFPVKYISYLEIFDQLFWSRLG